MSIDSLDEGLAIFTAVHLHTSFCAMFRFSRIQYESQLFSQYKLLDPKCLRLYRIESSQIVYQSLTSCMAYSHKLNIMQLVTPGGNQCSLVANDVLNKKIGSFIYFFAYSFINIKHCI